MAEPFLAEIKIFGFNFAPRGYALCDGQILPINQNQSLYSLLGTVYGGDGRTTFGLPDLRGRTPIGVDSGPHDQGQKAGEEEHPLILAEMPVHTHVARAVNTDATSDIPDGSVINRPGTSVFGAPQGLKEMGAETIDTVGVARAHNNMQPYLAINFCIALQGLFPSRN